MGIGTQPHQQLHDEDAILRIQQSIQIPCCQIGTQCIPENTGKGRTRYPTYQQTETMEEGRKKEREGTEEEELVQEWRVRLCSLHSDYSRWEVEEDARTRNTKERAAYQGGRTYGEDLKKSTPNIEPLQTTTM